MKISKKATNFVAIKCFNSSEWDNTTHLIVRLDKDRIKDILNKSNPIIKNSSVSHISHYYYNFLTWQFDEDKNPEMFKNDITFLNIKELPNIQKDSEKLDIQYITVSLVNNFYFQGFGKYSGIEFYTDSFKLEDFENNIKR